MLGKPWLFGQICNQCIKPSNVGNIILEHLDLMLSYYGKTAGVTMFRKHVAWYSVGEPNATNLRLKVNQITDEFELKKTIKDFWCIN